VGLVEACIALQVGLFFACAGQVQQVSQREVARIAVAQGFATHRIETAEVVQAAGFIASHPNPVAREGGT
jgi:hypothetical protein